MWKRTNGRLIQMTDPSRTRFKTYISKNQLEKLERLAAEYDTYVSYLLENGLKNALATENFIFSKKNRLRDKVEFRTTCDKEILEQGRFFAKKHKLNLTDVIQVSVDYIDLTEIKNRDWRYRTE